MTDSAPEGRGPASAVDGLLSATRRRLERLERLGPAEAEAVARAGGLLIDIRPAAQRAGEGEIPGSLIIERNDLEWRLDPTSAHRHPAVTDPGQPMVVVCQEGYASSFAAASLQALGLGRATDLDGGFAAWRAAGLPVGPGPTATGAFVAAVGRRSNPDDQT